MDEPCVLNDRPAAAPARGSPLVVFPRRLRR
jgi:hypothetical protein